MRSRSSICSANSSGITKQWLDTCLVCKGGTYPAQLMYQELADMACDRITAGITRGVGGHAADQSAARSVQSDRLHGLRALQHVPTPTAGTPAARRRRTTSTGSCSTATGKPSSAAWPNPIRRCVAYTKNHNLGLEVPYRYGSETRKYLPDFIVLVDDGHGPDDLLHLVVEIKGYRREDAKEKKSTMETYWVPGVNNLKTYGRWAFAEFTEIYQIEADFEAKVESEFNKMIDARRRSSRGGSRARNHGQEAPKTSKIRRNPAPRRGQAEEHPHGRVPVRAGEGRSDAVRVRLSSRATPTSTRSSSGAARTSRTGATSSSMRRRSTSRRRSTRRC